MLIPSSLADSIGYNTAPVSDPDAQIQVLDIPSGKNKVGYSSLDVSRVALMDGNGTVIEKMDNSHSLKSNEMSQCSFLPSFLMVSGYWQLDSIESLKHGPDGIPKSLSLVTPLNAPMASVKQDASFTAFLKDAAETFPQPSDKSSGAGTPKEVLDSKDAKIAQF